MNNQIELQTRSKFGRSRVNVQVLSDLHLEFEDFHFRPHPQADFLVFAGDLAPGCRGVEWLNLLKTDLPIIYVLGNHEYYKKTYPTLIDQIRLLANDNVFVLENERVEIDGVCFHGCTLWADFELFFDARNAGWACQQQMNDFRYIRRQPNYSKIRPQDIAAIHRRSKKWLSDSLEDSFSSYNVVVTHHAPSLLSSLDRYKDDIVTAGYASSLEEFISARENIDLWIHGHMHNSSDYEVGVTRVVSNPKGYRGENRSFEPLKIVKLKPLCVKSVSSMRNYITDYFNDLELEEDFLDLQITALFGQRPRDLLHALEGRLKVLELLEEMLHGE